MQKIEFKSDTKQTLFDAILKQKPNLNFQILNKLLRKKDIKVNGKKVALNKSVEIGDTITLFLPNKTTPNIDIVYEDDQILIVFKPQGIETTLADKVFVDSLCLEEIFVNNYACHRLDKNTEGLLVMAKNAQTRDLLFDCFKNQKIHKFYQAICFGDIKQQQTFVDYHKKQNNKVFVFSQKQTGTTEIITSYKTICHNTDFYLLDINIKTGKTHQIRAQLAHHSIYILGDERYGNKQINKQFAVKKQQLCAYKLIFDDMPKQLDHLSKKTYVAKPTFLKKYGF